MGLATVCVGLVPTYTTIGIAAPMLLVVYGSTIPVSLYAAAMTGPALVCVGMVGETRGADVSA
jgi:hypothetical protein